MRFTSYQKFVVGLLAFLQFTVILDYMILWPLGAILMPSLGISPQQFGTIVSVYAFSAGVAAFISAGFADFFDRKKLLLFFYTGFVLATFLCGLATTYEFLLIARVFTGIFGGVIGSIVLAVATDLFPLEMRGRVMGIMQTSYAASQVLGLPGGLLIATLWGWQAPFFMIVAFSLAAGAFLVFKFRPVIVIEGRRNNHSPLLHLTTTLFNPKYTLAFCAMALLTTGAFFMMPFGSAYMVGNLGAPQESLSLIYLVTGLATIFIGPVIGRMADTYGKFHVFTYGAFLSCLAVFYYSQMEVSPLPWVVVIHTALFVTGFSRLIPAQALTSAVPTPADRGAFMAVSSSLQQVFGGMASLTTGLIVSQASDGRILNFHVLGYIVCVVILATYAMMYFVHRRLTEQLSQFATSS